MEKARYNTELYSNLRAPRNNVKPSNFWGSHQLLVTSLFQSKNGFEYALNVFRNACFFFLGMNCFIDRVFIGDLYALISAYF